MSQQLPVLVIPTSMISLETCQLIKMAINAEMDELAINSQSLIEEDYKAIEATYKRWINQLQTAIKCYNPEPEKENNRA